jgi:hypothetical protein
MIRHCHIILRSDQNLLETADNILSQKIRKDAMEATTTTTKTTMTPSNNPELNCELCEFVWIERTAPEFSELAF